MYRRCADSSFNAEDLILSHTENRSSHHPQLHHTPLLLQWQWVLSLWRSSALLEPFILLVPHSTSQTSLEASAPRSSWAAGRPACCCWLSSQVSPPSRQSYHDMVLPTRKLGKILWNGYICCVLPQSYQATPGSTSDVLGHGAIASIYAFMHLCNIHGAVAITRELDQHVSLPPMQSACCRTVRSVQQRGLRR